MNSTQLNSIPTMNNPEKFRAALAKAYTDLFTCDPEYAYSASKCSPQGLALKMLPLGATKFVANKDGEGVRRACKECGIKHTYAAIDGFLSSISTVSPPPPYGSGRRPSLTPPHSTQPNSTKTT